MLDKIKKVFSNLISACTIIFIAVYIIAWACNAIIGTKFVMAELVNLWQLMIPKVIEYVTKSKYNTPLGTDPNDKKYSQ